MSSRSTSTARRRCESGDISVRVPIYIGLTEEAAIQDPRESIDNYFARMRRFFDEEGGGGSAPTEARRARSERLAKMSYEEILETKVIFGTPEMVTDKLANFQEMLGLSGFTAELNPGGLLPPEAVKRSLKLLTQEVMPAFR